MEQIICLAMGYVFGLFQTGFIYGRSKGIDIRQHGSGNSGSTNALRVMGVKAGLIVFMGDFLKTVIPCFLVRILFRSQPGYIYVLILCAGFGVILGHNFPFYLKFKGGKGIAASAGLLASLDWRLTLICLVVFVATVAVTRYVSLGSIFVMILFILGMAFWGHRGDYGIGTQHLTEFYLVAALIGGMGIWRHHANIKRLINGTENKLGAKKKE